jgi:hypothetical protein
MIDTLHSLLHEAVSSVIAAVVMYVGGLALRLAKDVNQAFCKLRTIEKELADLKEKVNK